MQISDNISKHYLYRHIRIDKDEPFYVGIGTRTKMELKNIDHVRAKVYHNHNPIWESIIAKTEYSIDILVESDDYTFIRNKEREFVKLYGRINLGTGILANLTDGGEDNLGWKPTKETLQNMSEGRKGEKNHRFGKRMPEHQVIALAIDRKEHPEKYKREYSQEEREDIRKRHKGRKRSKDTCSNISNSLKGHSVSEETKKKISEKAKSRDHKNLPYTGKSIINTLTGIVYPSIIKAAISYGCPLHQLRIKMRGEKPNDTPFKYYENANT